MATLPMQPIQGFNIDWNAIGGTNSAVTPTTTSTSSGYIYPSLSDLSNPGIDRYNEVVDYYTTHPRPYVPMLADLNSYTDKLVFNDLINSLPYQEDPRYASALSEYNQLTGGDPNYYQSVSNLAGMKELNDANRAMADAREDYTWAVLNNGVPMDTPASEEYMPTYFDKDPIPVGVIDGKTIYAFGATPGQENYYINKEGTGIDYFAPDYMSPLEAAFVGGVLTLMGGIAGGPFGAAAVGAGVGAAAGSLVKDEMNEQPLDWGKAAVTGLATYGAGAAGQYVGSAVGEATGSAVAGGAAGGATGGVVSATPQAIKEESWSPIVRGGLTGAVTGGLGGAAHELGDLYKYGESLGKAGSTAYDGGSMSYDGGVSYVPVGAGSFADSAENPTTLNQLMTELETPSGGGMSLANDPIPTESINPTGTPEFSATALPDTDTSSMNITDSFQYAEPAYKTAKTAYNLYNIGKDVYNNYQNYQDIKDQQPVTQSISQPVQTPITAPVGVSYTLGNMPIGEDERRAWGRVLV
jgi:hypothetical protein